MKRVWAAALSLCLALSLAACGDDSVQREPTASVQGQESSAADGTETVETENPDGTETGGTGASENSASGTDGQNTDAAPADGVSIQAILDANRTETLVANRGSFLMETSYAPEIDTTGLFTEIYADGENIFLKTDTTQELHTNHGAYLLMEGYFGAPLTPEPPTRSDFSMIVLDEEMTLQEEITSVERDGDALTVRTVLSAKAIEGLLDGDYFSASYAPGDFMEMTYTLDAADLAVLGCDTVLRHADGSSLDTGPMKMTYGADLPEDAAILREHLDAPDRRTVTVVLDPETPEETVYSTTAQKGDTVFPFLPDGYFVLYRDPACTQEFDGEPDVNEDVTLYVPHMDVASTLDETDLANLADAGEEELYDGASHRHAEDAERDMMEEEAARENAEGNP